MPKKKRNKQDKKEEGVGVSGFYTEIDGKSYMVCPHCGQKTYVTASFLLQIDKEQ